MPPSEASALFSLTPLHLNDTGLHSLSTGLISVHWLIHFIDPRTYSIRFMQVLGNLIFVLLSNRSMRVSIH